MRTIHAVVAASALAAAPLASATFVGVAIDEITGTLPAAPNLPSNLRTFRLYALFDGAGTPDGTGRVNTVLSVGQPDANTRFGLSSLVPPTGQFFHASAVDGAPPSNLGGPDLAFASSRGLHDTFVTIGLAAQDSDLGIVDLTAGDPDYGFFNGNLASGPASLGLGAGHDRIGGGWYNTSPPNLQGAASFNAGLNRYETLLAQFSVNDFAAGLQPGQAQGAAFFLSDIFSGELTIYTQAADNGADANRVIFNGLQGPGLQPPIPAPGALSLIALAALTARRRRA